MKWFSFCFYSIIHCAIRLHYVYCGAANVTVAELNVTYNGVVGNGNENIYFFDLTSQLKSDESALVRSCSSNASLESPMSFVVRKYDGVVSWSVPYVSDETSYTYHTQTICRSNASKETNKFFLDISTLNPDGLQYSIRVEKDLDYELEIDVPRTVQTNPAQMLFFSYEFHPDDERVLVKAESDNQICSVLAVQNTKRCDTLSTNVFLGPHATMTTKAGIVVEKRELDKIYIQFIVQAVDDSCRERKGTINPFKPLNTDADYTGSDDGKLKKNGGQVLRSSVPSCNLDGDGKRNKNVTITITRLPRIEDYGEPIAIPLLFYGMFYVVTLLVMGMQWCLSDTGGRSFYAYLFPEKMKKRDEIEENEHNDENVPRDFVANNEMQETNRLIQPVGFSRNNYNTIGAEPINREMSSESNEYDFLDDIEDDKNVYRLNLKLQVSDTSKKSYKKLEKKFNVYYWNLMSVAVFYVLPAAQLVITFQRVTIESGDQDICYYNFFCQRPYHIISSFNNLYSNIGYMLLGLLFIFFVMRRDRLSYTKHVKDPEFSRKYGLPKHYGIYYALGWSLVMEGIMSACYHVCPNYSNFQFDTAFMYILGILCSLRLYQGRHHDIFINAHFAFAGFAAVIFTSVIGVVYRSQTFWIIFCFVHILACLYLSLQMYYLGRARYLLQIAWSMKGFHVISRPLYPVRFSLLVIFNIVNWSLSLYGAIKIPKDFATYLLSIIIVNGLIYTAYYVIMKKRYGETVNWLALFFAFTSLGMWTVSLYFFLAGLTNWMDSAAESREGNKDCILFNFYDHHDLWHFLSAVALFFSFMTVLTMDDDLDSVERTKITVF